MSPSLAVRTPQPAYLIRTKHHQPPTYFGTTFERVGRSSVFAFASRALATRVAQGLEAHRRIAGHFPVISAEALELGDSHELHDLDMLQVERFDPEDLAALIGGSGVVLCYLRMDDEDEEIHANIVYDRLIQRTWIHDLYMKC